MIPLHWPAFECFTGVIMDRRQFLRATAASAAVAAMPKALLADDETTVPGRLTLQPNQPGHRMAKDFLGVSYETRQLSQPEFFSAQNAALAGFFRTLGTGVLRIGGNSSEFGIWTPSPGAMAQSKENATFGPDTGHGPSPTYMTTPQAIRNLREFLDMIGWRAIYGLNLGKGTTAQAADEAAFVSKTLGDRLICFQIGNEADLYRNNGLRPRSYDYADFARDWRKFHDAVKARVPGAQFAGPDTAGPGTWVDEFAQEFGKDVMLLTTHYYAEGPASDPSMNIDRLLRPNPKWDDAMPKIRQAMAESHLPYRLSETNSCYGGGKPGVSNTFASSLWALDLMLQLCAFGGSGINFHSGGYGWYAPVVGTLENGFVARPEYYAMLLASQLVGGKMVASHLDAAETNSLFVSYALTNAQGKLQMVVINKDAQKNLRLTVQGNAHTERISVQRLISPQLEDEQDTTFAGGQVGGNGAWKPERIERARVSNGSANVSIPAGSAALLSWE